MKYFITGISGFIGLNIAKYLLSKGHEVNAIIRTPLNDNIVEHPKLKLYKGDLHNKRSMLQGMQGCNKVFHLAGYAKPWAKNPNTYYRINVEGSINVFECAKKTEIETVVFTSSAATISPSKGKRSSDETTYREIPFFNEYESTKNQAEIIAKEYVQKGLSIVIVNPSRVYGPGPINPSNSITKMILGYHKGSWRIIPGNGRSIGNYVFIDDVVSGHILASEYGKPGERYILGGQNLSFNEFFVVLGSTTGIKRKLVHLPLLAMYLASRFMELQNHITGIPPLITVSFVKKYLHNWKLSSNKAVHELGYKITPFSEGVNKTINWALSQ
jgi:farnesol dehydrogenase